VAGGKIDNATIVVKGYKEFLRASKNAGTATNREVRATFREVGEIVRQDAAQRLTKYSTVSAAGLKVRVRQRGVAVEQSLRKTTGAHPQYGGLQMRKALLPALAKEEPLVEAKFEEALDKVKAIFEA
jgi:hypothetical protein